MVLPPLADNLIPLPPKRLITSPFTVLLPAVIDSPFTCAPAFVPSSSIIGVPAKSGSLVPSIITGSVIVGRALPGLMVCGPAPAMLKLIVSVPARALASSMAARNVHTAPAVAHVPLPGFASTASPVESTMNVVAAVSGTGPANRVISATRLSRTNRRYRIVTPPYGLTVLGGPYYTPA